jgi:hypothetical protein
MNCAPRVPSNRTDDLFLQVTSIVVVETHLARIEEVNPTVNMVTVLLANEAVPPPLPSTGRSPLANHSDRSRGCRSLSRRTLTLRAQQRA